MKLFFITNYPTRYRIDFFTELLHQSGGKENIRFAFIPDSTRRESISDYNSEIADVSLLYPARGLRASLKLCKALIQFRPNVIIVGGLNENTFFSQLVGKALKAEIFCWWAGTKQSESTGKLKFCIRKILAKFCKGGIFYSKDAEEYFLSLVPGLKKCFILGNNTRNVQKIQEFIQKLPNQFPDTSDLQHIITIGFHNKNKNTIALLQACRILQAERNVKGFCLDIVGGGETLEELKSYAKQHDLPVFFHGHLDNTKSLALLSQSFVLVHPSLLDRWPQVYSEALCCGIPALLSHTSGVSNAYTEKCGESVLFHGSDTVELADKLEKILTDPIFHTQLAEAQKECAQQTCATETTKRLLTFLHDA